MVILVSNWEHVGIKLLCTKRAQRADEKWVICLIILFNHRVRVIKMSKMAHFLYFLVVTAKKSKFEQNVQVHLKDPVVYF